MHDFFSLNSEEMESQEFYHQNLISQTRSNLLNKHMNVVLQNFSCAFRYFCHKHRVCIDIILHLHSTYVGKNPHCRLGVLKFRNV